MLLFGETLLAQTKKTHSDDGKQITKMQLENFFSSANESAILDKGKVSFLKLPISNEGEKLFSFTYAEDERSFNITDEKGLKLQVFLSEDRRIQSVVMPNGKKVNIKWIQNSSGDWIADDENFNCDNSFMDGNPCRDAAVATSIALGVCALTGGLSVPCVAATANAAYHTYRCYEAMENVLYNVDRPITYAKRFEFGEQVLNRRDFAKNLTMFNN